MEKLHVFWTCVLKQIHSTQFEKKKKKLLTLDYLKLHQNNT
jgi:hypothetical protein